LIQADDVGKRLYEELPQNTFTRTISNPEAVMKKRREQKLESKLRGLKGVAKFKNNISRLLSRGQRRFVFV
jgi:hypothetical protein